MACSLPLNPWYNPATVSSAPIASAGAAFKLIPQGERPPRFPQARTVSPLRLGSRYPRAVVFYEILRVFGL